MCPLTPFHRLKLIPRRLVHRALLLLHLRRRGRCQLNSCVLIVSHAIAASSLSSLLPLTARPCSRVRDISPVDKLIVSWGDIVALSYRIVVWHFVNGHVRLFQQLAYLERPLQIGWLANSSVGEWEEGTAPAPERTGHTSSCI